MIAPLNIAIAALVGWAVFGTKEEPEELPAVPPEKLVDIPTKKKRTRTRKKKK